MLKLLKRDNRGVTIVEFALIAPVFLLTLLGGLELAFENYFRSVLNGAVRTTAREASIGDITQAQVEAKIRGRISALIPAASRDQMEVVVVTTRNYFNFSNVGKPEKITNDRAPLNQYNTGDCFEDANGNGSYDTSIGESGLGGADDVVYYDVTVAFPQMIPLAKLLNKGNNTFTTRSQTVARNQPYADQPDPETVCT